MSNVPITDRSYQSSAICTIRNYLSLYSKPYFNKPPPPSAKDITDTIRFLMAQFYWPSNTGKLEEDLPSLLKFMMCPINLNKSAIKAPGTPHAWPSLLGVIYWLVQIVQYSDHKW
ncbi:hypothetical protein IFM89_024498 [Coptis chinensis]|uniref:Kinetochore protein NDC80 n=1 Tax=Coptis chinensis TaxID=261450 RepID=A0A835LNF0_9MAGN|nr:hypothetical protein IFM89_024498 [Coptis chinensis]